MLTKAVRIGCGLGLTGTLAIAAVAHADIPVTSGRMTGDAAFFTKGVLIINAFNFIGMGMVAGPGGPMYSYGVPLSIRASVGSTPPVHRTGTPMLFDTAIRTLRIVTPNGTTTTSRFLPTHSSFTDVNHNRMPDSGDMGNFQGTLSGILFSPAGSPTFFQGISTSLSFTLDSFTPTDSVGGTLVYPRQAGTAPLLFLPAYIPVPGFGLSDESRELFDANIGVLDLGHFTATLTGGAIALPTNLQLRPTGDVVFPVVELGRRVRFTFEGQNVVADRLYVSTQPESNHNLALIGYEGSTTHYRIESAAIHGQPGFRIEGTTTNLELEITGPLQLRQADAIDYRQPLNYVVQGEEAGYIAFGTNHTAWFTSTADRRHTQFRLDQGSARFEGSSSGDIRFALPGANDNLPTFNEYVGFSPIVVGTTNFDLAPAVTAPVTSPMGTVLTTTDPAPIPNPVLNATVTDSLARVFDPVASSNMFNADSHALNATDPIARQTPVMVVIEQDGDRILLVEQDVNRDRATNHRPRVIAAYQQIGLPSRVFPGLVGLQPVSSALKGRME